MKNLAKLKLQEAQAKGKTKPMASARTARAVPQMRKVVKTLTAEQGAGIRIGAKHYVENARRFRDGLVPQHAALQD